ncbi:MAG: aldehyde dehydrogenase family protein [Bacteroidia bacterium]
MAKSKTPTPKAAPAAKSNGKSAGKAAVETTKPAAKAAPAAKSVARLHQASEARRQSRCEGGACCQGRPCREGSRCQGKSARRSRERPRQRQWKICQGGHHAADVRLEGQRDLQRSCIGGAFPRTESGQFIGLKNAAGDLVANCTGAPQGLRNAVVVARNAFHGWSNRAHFNRGQILYRIAEMMESRRPQFVAELVSQGVDSAAAEREVSAATDRMLYYAGWCDKYQQVFSSVNAVSSSHFDFSMLEPMGVVSVFAPNSTGLLGFVSVVAPLIAGGNTVIVLASEKYPLSAITFAEALHHSDLPGGVVNILTGLQSELKDHFSTHMDVNAMVYAGTDAALIAQIQKNATHNVKRILVNKTEDWFADSAQSPYLIAEAQETKTTWHPVGI